MKGAQDHPTKKLVENFEKRALFREERKKARLTGERVGDLAWLNALPKAQILLEWEKIEPRLIQELEKAKLWHPDYDKGMIPNENGVPSAVKSRVYAKEDEEEERGEDFLDPEEYYDPELIDEIMQSGEIVEDEEAFDGEEPEQIETDAWDVRLISPKAAFSNMNILMRRHPSCLNQSIARALFDAKYCVNNERSALLPALCFFEVGIEDEPTFTDIRAQVYLNGPFHLAGKEFNFGEFQRDKLKLSHVLKHQKMGYFDHNRWIWRSAARVAQDPTKLLDSIWERFLKVYRSLTPKQRNAVREVHTHGRAQTQVARGMRISLDSLRDRLEGARIKFQNKLPELAPFRPSMTYKRSKRRRYLYSRLFDKEDAATVRPLYLIDPMTNERKLIHRRQGKPKQKSDVNLSRIKAWVHSSTQVPDFGFCDYFTKLIPKGHRDRMSAAPTPHDRGSTYPNHDKKIAARILTSPPIGSKEWLRMEREK
jgi:hypothetical protein